MSSGWTERDLGSQSEEERTALRATVRRFARQRVKPRVRDYDREEHFPRDLLGQMGRLGFFGGAIPERWGGSGLDHTALAATIEEFSRVDHALGMLVSMPSGLVGSGLLRYGTDLQRERWLTQLAKGEIFGGGALTEPHSGTDVGALRTTYRAVGGAYVLSGTKTWISNLDLASFFIAFARRRGTEGREGISAFIVPTDREGVSKRPFENKRAFRPICTGELAFDDVRLSPDDLLGEEDQGFEIAMTAVELGRLAVAAMATGMTWTCLQDSLAYAQDRVVFGRPLTDFQLTQQKLADMAVGLRAARLLVRRCADVLDDGSSARVASSAAKLFATDLAQRSASDAMQLHGAYGASEEYRIGRIYRDTKILQTGEGPNEVHRVLIARSLLDGELVSEDVF